MSLMRRQLILTGRVQGVCFRYYTRQTAAEHGVTGWVRNLPDGRVEVLLEGEEQAVARTLNWCRQGPELARVDKCEAIELPATGEFSDFRIL